MKQEKKELVGQFHRENIIKAAERIFIEKGYENATMDDVARAADYSKATIYVYFKSKGEIFDYIILKGMIMLRDCIKAALMADASPKDNFFDVCFAVAEFQEKYPMHYEGLLSNINIDFDVNDSENIYYRIYAAGEEINQILSTFLSEGMRLGIINKNLLLPQTILTLWASVTGIVRMAAQKAKYIEKSMVATKQEFLRYSFTMLYKSIAEGGK